MRPRSTTLPLRHAGACIPPLLAAVLIVAASAAWAQEPDQARAARLMDDLMWGRGHIGGPFKLVDHTGKTRTDAEFRGKLMLVYFGYTTCPDICPTDLTQIGLALVDPSTLCRPLSALGADF